MAELILNTLQETDLATIQRWFADRETRQRISYPSRRWFAFVCSEPNQSVWLARDEDEAIGYIQCERETDGTVAFAFVVRPDQRNRGHGKRLLRSMFALPECADAHMVWGAVERDNAASIRCTETVGFVPEPYDDEPTMLKMVYRRNS